jgi:hypothetical protein
MHIDIIVDDGEPSEHSHFSFEEMRAQTVLFSRMARKLRGFLRSSFSQVESTGVCEGVSSCSVGAVPSGR